ncbi:MAG TPA: glycosyltransferase family 4 protein [Thermoflexia bacterium]|nr:glycosyltransferase family 4 protein [Thermoflexia bacterium]
MRVLLITNYFPPHYQGGAEVMVYNTCHGLLQRGVDASILMINARIPGGQDRYRDVQGVPVHEVTYRSHLPGNPFLQTFDPRIYRDVMAEIRRVQPDLVHVHNVSGATLAPFVACRRMNVPVLLTLHDHWLLCPNNMLYKGDGALCDPAEHPRGCSHCFRRQDFWANIPWRRQIFARLVQNVRFFISPSQKLVDLHVAAGYNPARFRVVPNGIKPALFQTPSDSLVREYVRESGLFRTLLLAGAMVESKGIKTVIEALPLLARYVDRFRLLVAGRGEDRFLAALRRFDPSVVKLLGQVPFQEMRALYAATDLTVIPSVWYENSPMVIYESMLAGTPVLGSAIGGIPELIQHGETGYLFSPGDAVALTERVIQHFARSAPERRAMRRRCVEFAHTHMTLDRYLDRLQQVYDEALEA